jgi:hypothetical protein
MGKTDSTANHDEAMRKASACVQKMVADGNIPRGSHLTPGVRWKRDKRINGCDYITVPGREVISFEHHNEMPILDTILAGQYRISEFKSPEEDKSKRVVEVKVGRNWKKLVAEEETRKKWKRRREGS